MLHGKLSPLVLLLLLALGVSCTRDPASLKRKYVETGNKYFKAGKFREAGIMYRRALQKDLRYGEAYYRLALTYLQTQDFGNAVRALRRSIELDPKNTDAHARLADLFLTIYSLQRQKSPARGEEWLKQAEELAGPLLKADPRSYQGLRIRGLHAVAKGRLKDGIADLKSADEVQPLTTEVGLPLAQALIADGRAEEGERLLQALLGKHKEFGNGYDVLYLQYARTKRLAQAEQILRAKIANNPKEGRFRLQLAGHYYALQQRSEMVKVLEELTARHAEFPDAFDLAGSFYFRIREFDQAIRQYQEGERLHPKDKGHYRREIAKAMLASGRRAEAAQLVDSVLQADPKDADALAMRASLRLQSGDRAQLQSAIDDLVAAMRKMPDNAVVRFELGRAYLAKGDQGQARQQFQEAIRHRPDFTAPRLAIAQLDLNAKEYAKAMQGADELLKFDAGNVPARLIRTSAMIGAGEKVKARQELGRILQEQPAQRDAMYQLALLDFNERKFAQADAMFRKLYEMTPPDPRGVAGLVEVRASQGQFDAAIGILDAEIKKFPARLDLRLFLANTAVRAGRYPLAVSNYKLVLDRFPDHHEVHLLLGETYRRMGDVEQAKKEFETARKLAPQDLRGPIQLALLLESSGRRAEAKPLYQEILKREPDNAIALNNLAYMLAESGADLDQALTLAQRARQQMPKNPEVADTLGWIYIKKNLSDNAIQIFEELVRQNPGNAVFRYHLGMALFQKGDRPAAKRQLEAALRSKPSKQHEAEIKELISRIG